MNDKIVSALKEIENLVVLENEPMSKHTTFKIGGPAKLFLSARSKEAAVKALSLLYDVGEAPFVLGNGSNTLFPDGQFERTILKMSFNSISVSGTKIVSDAGAFLPVLSKTALNNSLTGLEFAQGIPGTVGGAIVMNAGAYGGEISDTLVSSTYFSNGEVITLPASAHDFSYRHSFYTKNPQAIVLSAEFSLKEGIASEISEKMQDFAARRREKQPLELPSAGSVFKRPVGYFAGALIEQCGLKGFSIGGASVSEKHAGFIVNTSGATSDDVRKLICHVQECVLRETGVSLECEICIL